ncbi:hypothetical protein, partial [Microbacterium sp. HMWF026]|uniref:hypothetical protein n=1 Tax=Microbacterium sp. HMWF026 TaxID=2056861 RepID=UPI001C639729
SGPLMRPPTLDQLQRQTTWMAWRRRALSPLNVSDLVTSAESRREFLEGCRLLGVSSPKPHQLLINDMLAAGLETNGVLIPRQAGKTKTLTIIALGRCALRERYNVGMTITTQATKTFEIFETTVIDELELVWPDEDSRPFKSYRGKGSQHVRFPNGSRFSAKSPKGSSFRASSYDLVWLDEGGEASPEQAVDLRAAIYSTFDTRPDAQLVVTGTAGTFRKGQLLFEALEDEGNGVVRYAFPEDVTADELAAWEPTEEFPYGRVKELTLAMHPGISSGLTTIEKVAKRFVALKERFAVEYGGIFVRAKEPSTPRRGTTPARTSLPRCPPTSHWESCRPSPAALPLSSPRGATRTARPTGTCSTTARAQRGWPRPWPSSPAAMT